MLSPDFKLLREIATPALVIDGDGLQDNVRRMAAFAGEHSIALRPHAKTHKTKEIAALQVTAGARGIACATIREAWALSAAGVSGLLVTSPAMADDKFLAAARINREHGLAMVVDHPAQVEALGHALGPGDPRLEVVVDVDVGQARTGVTSTADGVALARAIAEHPGMRFAGIQGYAGHAQHLEAPAARRDAAEAAAETLRVLAAALVEVGLPPHLITGSGTGTFGQDVGGPYNELQAGSYVFMDADYARILDDEGKAPGFTASLFVLATVISVNRPGQITVDAGTKALATNGPPPCVLIGIPQGSSYRFAGDEHGVITIPAGAAAPLLGARVLIGATHCDPTVNLHADMYAVADGTLERWQILARYGN